MFSLKDNYKPISSQEIESKISGYDLWRYYCHNFKEINKKFKSELYNDKNPSCVIGPYRGKLYYKDFGNSSAKMSVYDYIMLKYGCTYKECLNIIANDFKIRSLDLKEYKSVVMEHIIYEKPKIKIEIEKRPFSLIDFEYWDKYKIPLTMLDYYNVSACSSYILHKDDNLYKFAETLNNPIYAYRFNSNDEYRYKIYKPYEKNKRFKWLFDGKADYIEGFDQLDWVGDKLILTKSLKDCMVYRLFNYNAISLQGETNKLKPEVVNKLLKRFKEIIINYDNDSEGRKNTKLISDTYGFKYFFIDDAKDISDYLNLYGFNKAKKQITNKLNQLK